MTQDERAQFEQLIRTVDELKGFIDRNFNQDGTPKAPAIVIQARYDHYTWWLNPC